MQDHLGAFAKAGGHPRDAAVPLCNLDLPDARGAAVSDKYGPLLAPPEQGPEGDEQQILAAPDGDFAQRRGSRGPTAAIAPADR